MIRIICTSCKKTLEIDNAFAGSACRCQYCGTIQTVAKPSAQKAAVAGKSAKIKTLFENKSRGGIASGSGLEDLADIVASSGLSDARLRVKPPAPPPRNLLPLLGIAAAVIIVLLTAVLILLFRSGPHPAANAAAAGPGPGEITAPPAADVKTAANFCGLPIDEQVVVYLIDNGSSSEAVLDSVKSALFKSLASLGPDRRFRVLFWNPDSDVYPAGGAPAFAVKQSIDAAQNSLKDVPAQGGTDPLASLRKAMEDHPGQIILVTAKAGDLDDSLVDQVMKIRGASTVKIDAVAINAAPGDSVLSKIAAKTGGASITLSDSQLKTFAY